MKNLHILFVLLLYPFLFLLRYSLTLKGNVPSKQKHWKQLENREQYHQLFTYIIPIFFSILLVTSPLSAGADSCDGTVITGSVNDIVSSTDEHDYFQYAPGSGEVTISFTSVERINFYIGSTCGDVDILSKANATSGTVTLTLDATDTVYIHAQLKGNDAAYTINIDFTPSTGSGSSCANPRPYTRAYYANMPGQIDIIGNSVVCENDGSGSCSDPGDTRNNSINMMYINVDSDNSTFNHSSAELNLPEDSEIKWAGLYWQGMFAGPTTENQDDSKTIKFKVPGGSYVDITSDSSKHNWVYLKETQNRWMYQGVADVTHLIDPTNPNGYYGIANLHTQTGTPAGGSFGAWSIVIVYYNKNLPIRNLTVYDGYTGIMPGGNGVDCDDRTGDPEKACLYAEENGCPITLEATGVANPVSITLDGFLTPKGGDIDSSFVLFSGEGDRGVSGDQLSITNKIGTAAYVSDTQNPVNDVQNATISKNGIQVTTLEPQATLAGGTPWLNTLGADIDFFDISDKLDNDQSSTVVTMNTSGDGYFPGVFAFSTELYQPNICYDYAYKQYDRYFTEDNNGSFFPRLIGDALSTSEPITVEFYFQNTEASDIILENMTLDIYDINTTQATYVPSSTYLLKPGQVIPEQQTDTSSGPGYNNDIVIGDIDSRDFFYLDYDLDPKTTNIDMPLNIRLNYDVILPTGTGNTLDLHYETYINSDIPLCSNTNFSYTPAYGIFNVEDTVLSASESASTGNLYNLPTQTANRAGDFVIASYESDAVHTRKNVSTVVAIELIDAGKYHGIDASCLEPDSALGPRIWLTFGNLLDQNISRIDFDNATITNAITNGMVSDQILASGSQLSSAEEFYSSVRENTAFRIAYNGAGDGDLVQIEPVECTGLYKGEAICYNVLNFTEVIKYNGGNCVQDVDGQPKNIDTIATFCNNAGGAAASAMNAHGLAVCMECVYGFDVNFLCSRDNFSIRPESYRITLKDQDQSDSTQQNFITINDDPNNNHASDTAHHVAAGYNYALDINATNHQNDNPTPGYHAEFFIDGNNSERSFRLAWQPSTDDTKCNDTEDHNKTIDFEPLNGRVVDLNLSSAQVGKYDLTLFDKLWTRVDWDSTLMGHHTTGEGTGYFLTGTDCVENTSIVPAQGIATTISGQDLATVSGCDIISDGHINSDTGAQYTDIPLRVHPYKFDQSGVIPAAGPYTRTSAQTFIYINTSDADDKNMSYNMNGTFAAVGFDNGRLSNFVKECYADDVNMTLYLQYNSGQPTDSEPYLSYDFIDTNTTNPNLIIAGSERPTVTFGEPTYRYSTLSPLSITQEDDWFAKDMNGSITMDLGYNFKRTNNGVMNPRYIQMDDFNITYVSNPTGVKANLENDFKIFGNKPLDQNVSFLYARAKPGKFFYEDIATASVNTPVSIVAYCDLGFTECQNRGILAAFAKTNEENWWLSIDHRTAEGDGDIVLAVGSTTEGSGTPTVTPLSPNAISITSDATDSTIAVSRGSSPTLPMTVEIDYDTNSALARFTDKWLIYNEYNDSVPSPFYKVRFIGDANWTGIGDEGMVVGTEASKRKTKRLDW